MCASCARARLWSASKSDGSATKYALLGKAADEVVLTVVHPHVLNRIRANMTEVRRIRLSRI